MPRASRPAAVAEAREAKRLRKSCEDSNHIKGAPEERLQRSRADGVMRCQACRQGQKRFSSAVGTRGLNIMAHFRSQARQAEASSKLPPAAGPEASARSDAENSQGSRPAVADIFEEDSTTLSQSQESSSGADTDSLSTRSSGDLEGLCKCIGCDDCPRWYVVDGMLYDHWRSEAFTCSQIGEVCQVDESYTGLVGLTGPPGMKTRSGELAHDNCRPSLLPQGCWDVFRCGSRLAVAAAQETKLLTFVAPLAAVKSDVRIEAEDVLFAGFAGRSARNTITHLLGLRERGLQLRSGRGKSASLLQGWQAWLLWQREAAGSMAAAAVLTRQQHTRTGPKHLQGGMVLEYIVSLPGLGGRAHQLVLAAEEVSRLMGHTELFSACDLHQQGQAFEGRSTPALDAHKRWGFRDLDPREWHDRRLESYSQQSSVHFMVKVIDQ
eukprot:TRINITY_DN53239_c0_g1_i1.p1 TRINITY_DN53239_c0_g1~~TRINITY_DN53239_c0_g1_i1.p1  ORF type:complete len:450 (+),score=95.46 TRINITY_DN53239_c0_g1_i1:42-1352(+)